MAIGGQYGEDHILQKFFKDQYKGFIVDVGAADGCDNSNSYQLLQRPAWGGLLIEPEPSQFEELSKHYKDGRDNVTCLNCAVGGVPGTATLHTCLQVSTLLPSWRETCEKAYGVIYEEVEVEVKTLNSLCLLHAPVEIDLLSIDCEGMDWDVLCSLDLDMFKPRLICLEGFGFKIHGYSELAKTTGNSIYVRAH